MAVRDEIGERKRELRRLMTERRSSLTEHERIAQSLLACGEAARWIETNSCSVILAYCAFRTELSLTALLEWGWKNGLTMLLPRCVTEDRSMILHQVRGPEELAAGAYGLLEPVPNKSPVWERLELLDAVLVPGLAFDRTGGRLGYGAGYYDRFRDRLAHSQIAGSHAKWVGVGYDVQMIEEVPMAAHDARMDWLLTGSGIKPSI